MTSVRDREAQTFKSPSPRLTTASGAKRRPRVSMGRQPMQGLAGLKGWGAEQSSKSVH